VQVNWNAQASRASDWIIDSQAWHLIILYLPAMSQHVIEAPQAAKEHSSLFLCMISQIQNYARLSTDTKRRHNGSLLSTASS